MCYYLGIKQFLEYFCCFKFIRKFIFIVKFYFCGKFVYFQFLRFQLSFRVIEGLVMTVGFGLFGFCLCNYCVYEVINLGINYDLIQGRGQRVRFCGFWSRTYLYILINSVNLIVECLEFLGILCVVQFLFYRVGIRDIG